VRKRLIFAIVGVLALVCASVAYSQGNANTTTTQISFSGVSSKGGTKSKPKQQPKLNLKIDSQGTAPDGQPGTSTNIVSTLPKGWSFNTKKWPKSQRCSKAKANQEQSAAKCPAKSKVGGGSTQVWAVGGAIKRRLTITAVVLTNGNLGAFVKSAPTDNPQVNKMLEGSIKGGVWNVSFDDTVQRPGGIFTGIRVLDFKFNGKTKVKGKTIGVAQSTGCSGGKWTLKVQNTYRVGGKGKAATDSVKCRK